VNTQATDINYCLALHKAAALAKENRSYKKMTYWWYLSVSIWFILIDWYSFANLTPKT